MRATIQEPSGSSLSVEPDTRQVVARRAKVVILGAGFGGLAAARGLRHADVELTVIDRRNYHLFQPLLYQVATAVLSPAQIAMPIRRILSRQSNVTVLMERVEGIDKESRTVQTTNRRITYDYLVVATGARHAYFGKDEWAETAPGLKTIADATEIRARILSAFERAEAVEDEAERQRFLTFVVVGGGATGVELAGAITELARRVIVRDFRRIDPSSARVVLVEAGNVVLPTMPPKLSEEARRHLETLGVEVFLGEAVTRCDAEGVALAGGRQIRSSCVLWAAGVMASRAAKWLGVPADRAGRVHVDRNLNPPDHNEIFVIGDTASVIGKDGRLVPGVAPAAKQMGEHAARAILSRLDGRTTGPFDYRDYGNLATIGRKAAVADLRRIRLSGFSAWLLWNITHLWFLIGFRNRAVVFVDWALAYVCCDHAARLITDRHER
ncbi:NAD(P)/FAD-dependent oxidoreductase [Rhizobium bangladeshense]|uniref:NADH:ubiquinone reductase (non-electrogenic) n=1 Tax=Rhizobium bangladeshense TaxID=1138189 RepID=A0ABS7LNM3_9HYPH|nr:NAD(P)/FAD-dependent oxidoreductase [Rhizobium bangladeshense]MBX4870106.1 NAD(P)/FAD-dependent oxidoreductase [Rhizobium bangladeshense]MBX4904695.1 NAD(P)/FAD-dependent oxidoreductase [Rhizobium bangladeshense]MBX4916860.1 NAD(P)/FAD-dependent oxidoreductase [Rhizobium bangladeshense]MBX4923002.1 NAD(P)/FAD-dependent oxidoreductase [Rhizobium bangladeshense]MBX4935590.1 NAD(P)/FAD-dependent oxidoreductase [Rhizobium bangladeshense]